MDSTEEMMDVYLKVIKTVALKVKASETIRNLKAMLREREGISESLQEFFFTGEQLKDNHKLVDYGIRTNSTLHLYLQNLGSITVYIYIPSNQKTFELKAKARDTVQNIKFLIQANEGIRSDCYALFYGGKLLEDSGTLASLNIEAGSMLYLVFNPRDVLTVSVKMPSGEILKPEVKILYTIRDVKAIIGSMVGIPVSEHNLIYAGKQLEDCKTLACYNIDESSILKMLPFTFQIFVKDWNGKTLILNVRHDDTVMGVKNKVFNKQGQGVPVHRYYLLFAGKVLADAQSLASYNIEKNSNLLVAFRRANSNS